MAAILLFLLPASSAAAEGQGAAELVRRVQAGDVPGAVERYRARNDPASAEGRELLHELALAVLQFGVDQAGSHERALVAAVLAVHGAPGAYEILERGLTSPNRLVRQSAAEALAGIGSDRATTILRRHYERGPDARRLALDALARAGNEDAVDLFLRALRSPDPALRMAAMRGIGELRVEAARESLRHLWAEDSDPVLSGYAAYCLARLGNARAAEALKTRLGSSRADARDQAAALLGFLDDPTAKPLLRETLFDPSDFVRVSAIASLTRLQDETGLSIARHLLRHPEFAVRFAVASSFERMDYSLGRPLVLEALESEDPTVRAHALHAIREFRDTRALDRVRAFLTAEQDEFVRTEALLALGTIGDDSTFPWLLDALPDDRAAIRHAAAEAVIVLVDRLPDPRHGGARTQP